MEESTPLLSGGDATSLSRTEKAAWICDETLRGNRVPSAASLPQTTGVRRRHLRYQAQLSLRRAAAAALVLLSFVEVPAWCGRGARCAVRGPGGAPAELYMSGIATLAPRAASAVELVCLAFLVYQAWLRRGLLRHEDPRSRGNRGFAALVAVLALLVCDAAFAVLVPAPAFRLAPYLRAVLPLFYWRALQDAAYGVRALLRPFLDVLVFWVLFVLGSGWICTLLFHEMPAGSDRYWGDLRTGLLSSFIIATGADYPMVCFAGKDCLKVPRGPVLQEVSNFLSSFFSSLLHHLVASMYRVSSGVEVVTYRMLYIPALADSLALICTYTLAFFFPQIMAVYEQHRGFVFLFVGQVVIGIFLLFNFILAVVYNAYVSHIENVVIEGHERRIHNLSLAFSLVCSNEEEGLSLDEFKPMVRDLTLNPSVSVDEQQLELLFHALDDNGNKRLSRDEFIDLLDVLELEFEDFSKSQPSFVEKLAPSLYEKERWLRLMTFVRSNTFEHYIDAFMVLNLVVVLFESSLDLKDVDTPATVILFALVELGFSVVYIAEAFLKIAAMSWRRYWSQYGNRYDFVVMLALLGGAMYILVPFSDNNPQVIRYLVCLRCLRLLALLADIPRFRDLVRIFAILLPASVPLLSLFFLSLYFFSALGVQLFGGLIYEGNPALDETKHELVGESR